MKNDNFKVLIVKLYPLLIMISVLLFLLFMIIGFVINSTISNVFFALSFACLLLYIPSFILLSKLQHQKWFIKYQRCFSYKKADEKNQKILKQKAEQLLTDLSFKK